MNKNNNKNDSKMEFPQKTDIAKEFVYNEEFDSGEKMFTQQELEKLIGDRIKRERKCLSALSELKEFLKFLKEKEILKEKSYPALAKELMQIVLQTEENKPLIEVVEVSAENMKNLQEEPLLIDGENSEDEICKDSRTDISDISHCNISFQENNKEQDIIAPDSLNISSLSYCRDNKAEMEGEIPLQISEYPLKTKAVDLSALTEQNNNQIQASSLDKKHDSLSDAAEFIRNFGEQKLEQLSSDQAFISFKNGKAGSLTEIYTQYVDFLNQLSTHNEVRKSRAAQTLLASTGFSRHDFSQEADYSQRLTQRQREIAKNAGLSYKEYSGLLSQVPICKQGKLI